MTTKKTATKKTAARTKEPTEEYHIPSNRVQRLKLSDIDAAEGDRIADEWDRSQEKNVSISVGLSWDALGSVLKALDGNDGVHEIMLHGVTLALFSTDEVL